jgi:hypothetical protein
MATGFNTQIIDGRFHLQFETDKREYYKYVQAAARDCLDGKATDKCHRWISVEERLPENCEFVLCIVRYGEDAWNHELGFVLNDKWVHPGRSDGTVTHWMPLPEPPEVNEK